MLMDEITTGESVNLEFKVEAPARSEKYMKSIVAFANTAGGKLIIGIEDKTRKIVGVDKNEVFKIIDSITNSISDMCYPQIFPNIEVDTLEGKCIIVVEIYPGANRPYYLKSLGKEAGAYVRVSGTSRPADEAILKDLELQGRKTSFDEMICIEETYDAARAEELCQAIKRYMVAACRTESEQEKIKEVTIQNLVNWGIVKEWNGTWTPTNAFVLLTQNIIPFAKVQCALFKGTERVIFLDKREFDGPLYEQIEEAYQFVLKHIYLGAEIKGLIRTEAYELPVEAIREAIVNAVTHRNYLDKACIQVAVYDDRVEITSPGMLYGGLTIEQIKEGGSKIRNRCIAEVFSRMRIIESWGTGIKRMIASCREYGVEEPEILELGDSIRVNLYRPSYKKVHQNEAVHQNNEVHQNETVHQTEKVPSNKEFHQIEAIPQTEVVSTIREVCQTEIDVHNKALERKEDTATQQKIIAWIQKNPQVTQAKLAEKLGISIRAVKKSMKGLQERGTLERIGSARSGFWQIKKGEHKNVEYADDLWEWDGSAKAEGDCRLGDGGGGYGGDGDTF